MEQTYPDLGRKLLEKGHRKEDRTGTGTLSLFGHQMRFDLQKRFPSLTTKRVLFGSIKNELLWFLKGGTNIRYLLQNKDHIRDEWVFGHYIESPNYNGSDMTNFSHRCLTDPESDEEYKEQNKLFCGKILTDDSFAETYDNLEHIYGHQWRHWETKDSDFINQIKQVIEAVKKTPDSGRLIIPVWSLEDIPSMALPPCHTMFQSYVQGGWLSCQLYQRSGDVFLGVPFNVASYALLIHPITHEIGLAVDEFVYTLGGAHLYIDHTEQMKEQLSREIRTFSTLVSNQGEQSVFDFETEDIQLEGCDLHLAIRALITVQDQKG